ncbi:MAG: GGDEF domain-containing protein [Anaeromyxobacteraceae bacterium]
MEEATRKRAPRDAGAEGSGTGESRLVIVEGDAVTGLSVGLDREITLGRDPGCDVVLPSEDVSRRHARVTPEGGGHLLVDLGSTNGTHVNGWNVQKRVLRSGDRLQIGPFTLRYFDAGAIDARDLEEVGRLARLDPLTGIPNRRAFEETLGRAFGNARRSGLSFAVVTADLDHFKVVNDRLGHVAGDAVLSAVAGRLAAALREGDVVARVGGEEFAVVLPGAGLAEAIEVAERLRMRVAESPIMVSDDALAVTASFGCAALAKDDEEAIALLVRADQKLYAAKTAGRNRVMA